MIAGTNKQRFMINLIYDLQQYNHVVDPIKEELKRRNIDYVRSQTKSSGRGNASYAVQDVAYRDNVAPRPRFYHTHGIAGPIKGWALNFDFECFLSPSVDHTRQAEEKSNGRYDVIPNLGYVRTDRLFRIKQNLEAARERVIKCFRLDPNKPIVAFFPTYRKNKLNEEWIRNFRYDSVLKRIQDMPISIVVAPHQMDNTDEFIGVPQNITITKDYTINRLKLIGAADVLISDKSGVAFESCIFDRPTLLLGENFTTKEGEVLDFGKHCTIDTIRESIEKSLESNYNYPEQRQRWAHKILGPVDGQVSKRIVDSILEYTNE